MKKHSLIWICLALAALTLICYWPATSYDFVSLDDRHYISENPRATSGLSWSAVAWAFQTGYFCNWHPLTWLSYLLDNQLFGLNPGRYHLTNILFHVADTLLLLFLLRSMTQKLWLSAFVAALFAWHPLHVESVAWVSERKDVLSAFFWILSTMAYVRYVKLKKPRVQEGQAPESTAVPRPSRIVLFYLLSLLFFACGLMSKAMLVTLPCVLLLLDYWPLRRFELSDLRHSFPVIWRLVLEKLPFFALALVGSVVTYSVQAAGGAVSSLEINPVPTRLANALLSYVRYLGKTVFPANLSVMYPYPSHVPATLVIGSALVLVSFSVWCLWRAKRQPFLLVGWLWFVGTLVPVIGLIQVGAQAMADRYMYIPSIGLFMLLAWCMDAFKRPVAIAAATVSLAGCLVCTSVQVSYWRNSETLFRHALAVIPDNHLAFDGLGKAMEDVGKMQEAASYYGQSVRIEPRYSQGQYNFGTLLFTMGKLDEAVNHLEAAIKSKPNFTEAHNNLGSALIKLGRLAEAEIHLAKVVTLKPNDAAALNNFASVLLMQSKVEEARAPLEKSLRLEPNFAEAHRNLGVAFIQSGQTNEAAIHFLRAAELDPANPDMRFNLGLLLLDQGKPAEAAAQFAEGMKLRPDDPRFHYRMAVALSRQHKSREAILQYRETIRLAPDFAEARHELSRLEPAQQDLQ